ncbi:MULTISPECIES: flippase [Bacillaceae]|uniref:flippase n=1 Tax=Bacillaceae TaxID=186817 RepID=UPI002FFD5DD5
MKKNSIASNAVYLFFGNVLVRFLSAASTILVARHLGTEDYGILSISLAFASVAGYFTDLGLTNTLIREGTKENASIPVLMSSFFKVRIIFSILTIIISLVIVNILYDDQYIVYIHYLVLIPSIIGSALQLMGAAYYQLIEKMHFTALIRTIASLTTAAALILGMLFRWPLTYIAPVYGLASVIAGLISFGIVIKHVNIFKGWDKGILEDIWSFTLTGLSILLLPQIGPIIIEKSSTLKEAGLFSAAYRIPSLAYQIPGVVAAAFYPVLFRMGNNKEFESHLNLSIKEMKIMSFLGVAMAIPFLFYSEWWIDFLFGEKWGRAALPLSLLSLQIILQSFNYPMADALTTTGKQKYRMSIQISTLIIGAILYYVFSSHYGSTGGAIAALSSEFIMFVAFMIFHHNGIKLITHGSGKVVLSFAIIAGIYFILGNHIHPLVSSILLDLIFVILLPLIDKELRSEIDKRILSKIRSKKQKEVME